MIPIHSITKQVSLFLVFIFVFNCSYAQNRTIENEYVVISTDRSVYLSGEQIYFTAFYDNYLPESSNNISNILYVEVYNKREAIVREKFKITDKVIKGKLHLPDDIYSGNYYIRAYTKFQRNMPAMRMHNLLLAIVNPNEAFPKEDSRRRPLVESLRIDTDSSEYLFRFNGPVRQIDRLVLMKHSGETLKSLPANSSRLFSFKTAKNDSINYTVGCINPEGDTLVNMVLKDTPQAKVGMQLQTRENKAELYLNVNREVIAQYGSDMRLIVKNSHYETISDRLLNLVQDDLLVFKPERFSEPGIYYFILENFNSEIVYASAAFVGDAAPGQELFSLSQQMVSPRNAVTLNFKNESQVAYSDLSVLMPGLQSEVSESLPHHLSYSHTLLRSWLHTRPVNSKAVIAQLNAALRWQFAELNSERFLKNLFYVFSQPLIYTPDIRDVSISGKAIYSSTGKPAADIDVFASVVYGENQIHHVRTDKNGKFIFSLNNIEEKQNVFITTRPEQGDLSLNVLSDFHKEKPIPADMPLLVDTTDTELFRRLYLNRQLNQLFVKQSDEEEAHIGYSTVNFTGLQNYRTVLDEYIKMPNMEDVFHELVPFVKASETKSGYKLQIYNEELKSFYDNPLVLVDYMPVFDISRLMKTDPDKLELIDVINQMVVSGNYLFDGLVLITTKTKDFAGMKIPDKSIYLKYSGVQKQTYPVFPEYTEASDQADPEPDFRHVLHYRTFSQELPESCTFYTSDQNGVYEIILTGRTKDGRTFKTLKTISVK